MARRMKIGYGKYRLFRHNTLQTEYLIISSHGEAIAGREDWSPNFTTTMHFNRSYGQEAKGSPPHMLARVVHKDNIESIPSSGLVGDYALSKFQDYHDVASSKKQWNLIKMQRPGLEYEETYGRTVEYVDASAPACDILTIRNRWFNKESRLSTVCRTLASNNLRYRNIICLFCRVKQYAYFHDPTMGVQ